MKDPLFNILNAFKQLSSSLVRYAFDAGITFMSWDMAYFKENYKFQQQEKWRRKTY